MIAVYNFTSAHLHYTGFLVQGWVVRKPINTNPGLKVNGRLTFNLGHLGLALIAFRTTGPGDKQQ